MDKFKFEFNYKLNITLFDIVCFAIFLFAGCLTYKAVSANGQIEYCYITHDYYNHIVNPYTLYGYRPWREDNSMGAYSSVEEATKVANNLNCPLLHK